MNSFSFHIFAKTFTLKHLKFFILTSLIYFSCKQEQKTNIQEPILSESEKIAYAHGFEHWGNVTNLEFTFNVDRDSSHSERSWVWNPKTNDVTLFMQNDTISYNRSKIDSTNLNADRRFINDKFWLFIPFQLVWDEGTTISDPVKIEAPISKKILNKITVLYSNEGGYTPGDAYDIYYNDEYLIEEWIFRHANAAEPSISCTFENYSDFNGIKLALDHKKSGEVWNLNFTNVKVTLQD